MWYTSHTTCVSHFPSSYCLYSCWNHRLSHPEVWTMIDSTTKINICWLNQSAIVEPRDEGSLMEHSDMDELLSAPVYPPDYKLWIQPVNLYMYYGSILTQLLLFAILIFLIHMPAGTVETSSHHLFHHFLHFSNACFYSCTHHTILNYLSPCDLGNFSQKSPKTVKIETKLLPVSAKIGFDAWLMNNLKLYSNLSRYWVPSYCQSLLYIGLTHQ